MSKNLVIVESPAKAKTIEGYLGADFTVKSCMGHIRDLPKGDKAIDIANNFSPQYEVMADKKQVVKELKDLSKGADFVWLATDDDREGEAISWHLYEALKLTQERSKRIVFREITKNAILNAIKSPRTIDTDLVNAQQARRIMDRLVGFEISPILWKKIKRGLSAGRVQSVAVRLIVEREREIEKFSEVTSYRVTAEFDLGGNKKLAAELPKKFSSSEEAEAFLEKCKDAEFSIRDLETKPLKKSPAPPFTTSTMQQEASRKLGYSVSQTMTLAQRLYEAGKITYMRTDSVNLAQDAIESAKTEIESAYGAEYFKQRKYTNKASTAQEAHEAIRPTNFSDENGSSDYSEQRLYDLIRKRAKASQMADAQLEKTTAHIAISTTEEEFRATGEVVKFEGFLKAYIESNDDEDDDDENTSMLPPLDKGQVLPLNIMNATQKFSRPSARYTEAALVKKLEEMGIGRPSTYAPTISTVQKRGYVIKESRDGKQRDFETLTLENSHISKEVAKENYGSEKNKMFPTDMAMIVNDFLADHFPNVINYDFTAKIEKQFDEISHGDIIWQNMLNEFYSVFHERVENSEKVERSSINTSKELGVDPVSGENVYVKIGRFGPYAQLGENPEDDEAPKPKYTSLRKGQLMETITLEEAMELFKLPKTLGEYEEKTVTVAIGRFGPYVRHDGKFASIPKEEDPHDVTLDRAIELIEEKKKADAERFIKDFPENPDVQILKGRYGPYIKVGKKNVKIPKEITDPTEITLEQCLEWAEKAPEKGKRGGAKKKKK